MDFLDQGPFAVLLSVFFALPTNVYAFDFSTKGFR